MKENTIYFKPTKRVKFVRSFNHALAGVLLMILGIENLYHRETGHWVFGLLAIVAGAAVFISFVRDMRKPAEAEPHGIHWFDVFAGVVILLEAWHKYKPGKGFQPATLLVLVGVLTFLMGLFHAKLAQLARFTCNETGFLARTSPFHKLQLAWQDIAAVQSADSAISLTLKDGQHRVIKLRRIENKSEVINFFNKHWRQHTPKAAEPA
jgi:hypothetical protein